MKIKKVKYVERARADGLGHSVDEMISKGWQPQGQPIVDKDGYLVQMMVKYAEDI